LYAESNRDRKKKPRPYKIEDFLLLGEKGKKSKKTAAAGTNKSGASQYPEPGSIPTMTLNTQRNYILNFLHPLFTARANLEKVELEKRKKKK